MRIYKPTYSKTLPEGAKILRRKSGKFAKFKDKKGHTKEARLTKSSDKILCETSNWHISFEDNLSIHRELKAYTYEQATKDLSVKIQKLLNYKANNQPLDSELQKDIEQLPVKIRDELIGFGLLDSQQAKAGKPLKDLVSEFGQFLEEKERTEKYIGNTVAELRRVFEGCSFRYWNDISPTKVMAYLKDLRDTGLSYRSSNAYLKSAKAFCKFMVDCNYVSRSPLKYLKTLDTELDRRRERRALTTDELRRLLETTINSEERFGMTGAERCLLYYVATQIGLRANEIRTLRAESFDLDDLTVTIEAGNSKHRCKDELPIRKDLGARLKEHFKGKLPTAKAFGGTYKQLADKTADMLKADLAEAKIEYIDSGGKVCDFHSLRGTFITALDKTDASLKERMTLARHSDRGNLTLGTYTDRPRAYNLRRVIEQLPDVWPGKVQSQKATGTDGKPVDAVGKILSKSCFSGDSIRGNTKLCEKKTAKTVEKMPLNSGNKLADLTLNQRVTGSNPVSPILSPLLL